MVEIKTDTSVDAMREAGRVVAQALTAVREAAGVGVSLRELDEAARAVLREAGASSPFLDYHPYWAPVPFPAVICASVNDAIVHGIPDGYRLRDGDLVSIDCGATLDGWCGDSAVTFSVGTARPDDIRLAGYRARGAGRGHLGGGPGQPDRRHRPRDRPRLPVGGVRHPAGVRRPRRGPHDARGPRSAERGTGGAGARAAARDGAGD